MKTPDLHPDELLDKDVRGELSASERASLEDHLARCAVCRFEQRARLDFSEELAAGSASVEVEDLVARALGLAGQPRVQDKAADQDRDQYRDRDHEEQLSELALPRRRWKVAPLLAAAVAAAMTVAGVAAARWTGVWSDAPETLSSSATESAASGVVATQPTAHSARSARVAPTEESAVPPEPPAIAPVPSPSPSVVSQMAPQVAPSDPRADLPKVDASTLFAQANHARASGQHAEAVRTYRDLLGRFSSSPEARLSRATLGRLLLDDNDAAGALEQLDAYLRDGDLTLREEAMANRATALGHLGRAGEESAAWSALLDSYPQSIHGARARARIGELGPR